MGHANTRIIPSLRINRLTFLLMRHNSQGLFILLIIKRSIFCNIFRQFRFISGVQSRSLAFPFRTHFPPFCVVKAILSFGCLLTKVDFPSEIFWYLGFIYVRPGTRNVIKVKIKTAGKTRLKYFTETSIGTIFRNKELGLNISQSLNVASSAWSSD